jgi:hypothetical protein
MKQVMNIRYPKVRASINDMKYRLAFLEYVCYGRVRSVKLSKKLKTRLKEETKGLEDLLDSPPAKE